MVETEASTRQEITPRLSVVGVVGTPKPNRLAVAFGLHYFPDNLRLLGQNYSHRDIGHVISFREPLIYESISALALGHSVIKKQVDEYLLRSVQLGRIVCTSEGFFTNTSELNPDKLKKMLCSGKREGNIYILDRRTAFIPYDFFKQREYQEQREFAEGALSRGLEHTDKTIAKNLNSLSDKTSFPMGVRLFGFNSVSEPVARIISLASDGVENDGLKVYSLPEDDCYGYLIGIQDKPESF